jgi:hypothetical protein
MYCIVLYTLEVYYQHVRSVWSPTWRWVEWIFPAHFTSLGGYYKVLPPSRRSMYECGGLPLGVASTLL